MAFINWTWCSYCGADREHLNRNCRACADRLLREKRAIWNSKTPEEKIEELLKRIESLENRNDKYA